LGTELTSNRVLTKKMVTTEKKKNTCGGFTKGKLDSPPKLQRIPAENPMFMDRKKGGW